MSTQSSTQHANLNIVWFRSDLRVYDNPALYASMSQGPTVAIYFLVEEQWNIHGISPAKRALILRQLVSLESELAKLHVPLLIVDAQDFSGIPNALKVVCLAHRAKKLFYNHEYEVNEQACAAQVNELLKGISVSVNTFHDACVLPPGTVRNQQGEPYKVFSAFKRAYIQSYHLHARSLLNRPQAQRPLSIQSDLSALPSDRSLLEKEWPAGEDEAHERLNRFIETQIKHYKAKRDFPFLDATSQLSPYLAVGALSTMQCMHAALSLNKGSLSEGNQGISTWINELIWREFYKHLLVDFPRVCMFKPFKLETDRLPWKPASSLFDAWKAGKTGYPIVDAAMRQLNETAWMHNRLRMVVAMFLTKHLFIDWRLGEAYFMSHLVDGDLAANNGGWQWSASTGVDAVPYFRIFNPVRQSQRFDEQGDFIRKYIPELRHLDNKSIHMPSPAQAKAANYPLPIVDHSQAVAQTKLWFKELNEPRTESDLFSVLSEESV